MQASGTPWRSAAMAVAAVWLAGLLSGTAAAQGIELQSATDDSSDLADIDELRLDVRFASRLTVAPPTLVGDRAELALHHSWSFATLSDLPIPFNDFHRRLGWSLILEVQDPLRRGFDLQVDQRLRGVLGAGVDAAGQANVGLPGMDIWVYEAFATVPRHLEGLSTERRELEASNGIDRLIVDQGGRDRVGRYVGTQSFLFYMAPAATAMTAVQSFVPDANAYAWLQFGRGTVEPGMAFLNPGPGDPALDTLGQFVTFRVDYTPTPVPEPAAWALWAAGALWTVTVARRRQA